MITIIDNNHSFGANAEEPTGVREVLGVGLIHPGLGRLRVHNLQALQRCERHRRGRAGHLSLDGSAAAVRLLLAL